MMKFRIATILLISWTCLAGVHWAQLLPEDDTVPLGPYYAGCQTGRYFCLSLSHSGKPNCIQDVGGNVNSLQSSSSASGRHCRGLFVVDTAKDDSEEDYEEARRNKSANLHVPSRDRKSTVELTLIGNILEGEYIAGGLSKDAKMGLDSVGTCYRSPKQGTTFGTGWNQGHSHSPSVLQGGHLLEGIHVSSIRTQPLEQFDELGPDEAREHLGRVTVICKWTRPRYSISHGVTFNFDNETDPIYLLIAMGSIGPNDRLQRHHMRIAAGEPLPTPGQYGYLSGSGVWRPIPVSNISTVLRIHIILIDLIWMFAIPAAVLVAKFFKTHLFGIKLNGKDLWFVIHQAVMAVSMTIQVVAFALVYIHVYSGTGRSYRVGGAILMGTLSTIHSLYALLFRPHPGTDNRIYFDWAHSVVGHTCVVWSIAISIMAAGLLNHLTKQATILVALQGAVWLLTWCIFRFKDHFLQKRVAISDAEQKAVELQLNAPPSPQSEKGATTVPTQQEETNGTTNGGTPNQETIWPTIKLDQLNHMHYLLIGYLAASIYLYAHFTTVILLI